jgi:hypothetical protein
VRSSHKRPYQQDREEISYVASQDMLERVAQLPEVQVLINILKQREKALLKVEEESPKKAEDEDNEDGPPQMKGSGRPETKTQKSAEVSIVDVDGYSSLQHIADILVKVCNAKTLEKKRKLVEGFNVTDPDFAAFSDVLLKLVGARDGEGRFVLNMN